MPLNCPECERLRAEYRAAAGQYDEAKRALENCHSSSATAFELDESGSRAISFYQAAQHLNDATFRLRHHQATHGVPDEPSSPSLGARL